MVSLGYKRAEFGNLSLVVYSNPILFNFQFALSSKIYVQQLTSKLFI